ncbi:MAG: M23 family metallopeptidase [Actinomycetes bacterium]|jgi:hypothetical protein|nr:M23 family metallopeptidase [Actinomycetes bacterium]
MEPNRNREHSKVWERVRGAWATHTPKRSPLRSTAQRRDPERPRVITSNTSDWSIEQVYGSGVSPIRPARDAGLTLTTRAERRAAEKRRARTQRLVAAVVVLVIVFAAGMIWMASSNKAAEEQPFSERTPSARGTTAAAGTNNGTGSGSDSAAGGSVAGANDAGTTSSETSGSPTPIVATYKKMQVRLPVALEDLTEVAFHPANYGYAVKLSTHMPELSLEKAKKKKGTGRDISVQPAGADALLVGSCLKMWRSGRGTNVMTSMDIGAAAGTVTYAPVDGVVSSVRVYRYDNKVNDYEIHVACDDAPGIEMVMIHVKKPVVQTGDVVVGGVTPMAQVRNISKYVRNQLATYTGDKGNHTHIQFNDTTAASYKARQKKLLSEGWYISID